MKRIVVIVASPRKKLTWQAAQEFVESLGRCGAVEAELIMLSDYRLELCKGCCACFNNGEERCPLDDDRDLLIEKLTRADGVIFATPTYAFHVTAQMKTLLDRLAFLLHRPRFFGKPFTAIATQGMYGGKSAIKYLEFTAEGMGFHSVKGVCLQTLEPMTERQQVKNSQLIARAAERYWRDLVRERPASPSFFRLVLFRICRTSIRTLDERWRDYRYYRDQGWFTSGYYCAAPLGPVKRLVGGLSDALGRRMASQR